MMIVNVSTLNEYTFCPRSVYLSKVLNLKPEPSAERAKGIISHAIRKELSLRQGKLLGKIKNADNLEIFLLKEFEDILKDIPHIYKEKFEGIINLNFYINEIRPELLNEIKLMKEKLTAMIETFGIKESLRRITPWKVEFSLRSEKLKFSGRVDKVMKEGNEIIPIEIKTGGGSDISKGIWEGDRLQTCAYAMLLEEKFKIKRIPFGFVEYPKIHEKKPVMITEQLRRRVIYTRDEIIEILSNKKIPPEICPHGSGKKCQSCGFKEKCYEI